jgi:hypothetical protein
MENLTQKLDPEFKAKWIAALRSGEFKQCATTIHTRKDGHDSYCCIGVGSMVKNGRASYNGLDPTIDGGFKNPLAKVLIDMNDGYGVPKKSFPEIADYIEANL